MRTDETHASELAARSFWQARHAASAWRVLVICAALAASAAVLTVPVLGPARANLALSETSALVVVPFLTAPGVFTEVVVTNGLAEPITLAINVLNGDAGEAWDTASFECRVSARETTRFEFQTLFTGSLVDFECSTTDATSTSAPEDLNVPRRELLTAESGLMVVAIESGGATVSKNGLFADATIVDVAQGSAYSVAGIGFQGLDPLGQDGDRQYRFDGLEYAEFPASLATNFHAPDADTTAELWLFTLDGTADVSPVPAALRVFFYNDDELERDANTAYDCIGLIPLEAIDPRFSEEGLGSPVGHLTLRPRAVAVTSAHETTGVGSDGFRVTPSHGWLLQTLAAGAGIDSVARSLQQSLGAQLPLPGDVINFDAR